MRHNGGVIGVASSLLLSAALQDFGGAWNLRQSFAGSAAHAWLGIAVAGPGDLDGDGFDDSLIGAGGEDPGGLPAAGCIRALSGTDGRLLAIHCGSAAGEGLGLAVGSLGDLDGDGVPDLLAGAPHAAPGGIPEAGAVRVWSGASGLLLLELAGAAPGDHFGYPVQGAGDVDGDGIPEILVGASDADPQGLPGAGVAELRSGADGHLLFRFEGSADGEHLGFALAGGADCDRDGIPDLLLGAPDATVGGMGGAGRVELRSGADGHLLLALAGTSAGEGFGAALALVPDLDGDGRAELLIASPTADRNGRIDNGGVGLWDPDGIPLAQWWGEADGDEFGLSVAAPGDVDGDGLGDLVIGAHRASPGGIVEAGATYVYSGADRAPRGVLPGASRFENSGTVVAGAGDGDGDGRAEILSGAPDAVHQGWTGAGSAYRWAFDPFLHPSGRELSASGGDLLLDLAFPVSEAGVACAVLAAGSTPGTTDLGGVVLPLANDSILQRMLGGWTPNAMQGSPLLLDAQARGSVRLVGGAGVTPLIGARFRLAALSFDPGPLPRLASAATVVEIIP